MTIKEQFNTALALRNEINRLRKVLILYLEIGYTGSDAMETYARYCNVVQAYESERREMYV